MLDIELETKDLLFGGLQLNMRNDILSNLRSAKTDNEREWLVMKFAMESLSPVIREAVRASAIPHWFDISFLNALLDQYLNEADFKTLTTLSFIETFPDRGYNVHERTRKLILEKIWHDDPDLYRAYSRKAAAYCKNQNKDDTSWKIETIYHLLIAKPEEGTSLLKNQGMEWQNHPNFAFDKVETMTRSSREHADANRLSDSAVNLTLFWETQIDKINSR
jgi:hypothetical protein